MRAAPLSLFLALALALVLSACAAPRPDLTGVWEERDGRGTLLSLWSFASDGRFTFDHLPEPTPEDAEHLNGTFQILTGPELLIDGVDVGARQRLHNQSSIYVHDNQLALEAFIADEPQPELLGTWCQRTLKQTLSASGEITFSDRRTQTMELLPDGQLRLVQSVDDDPPQEVTGRYAALGAGLYRMTIDLAQVSIDFTLQLVNGEALAPHVYQRTTSASSS